MDGLEVEIMEVQVVFLEEKDGGLMSHVPWKLSLPRCSHIGESVRGWPGGRNYLSTGGIFVRTSWWSCEPRMMEVKPPSVFSCWGECSWMAWR